MTANVMLGAKSSLACDSVIAPVTRIGWAEVANLDETARGSGGFGSSGKS